MARDKYINKFFLWILAMYHQCLDNLMGEYTKGIPLMNAMKNKHMENLNVVDDTTCTILSNLLLLSGKIFQKQL
jgi:hypothetical protein